MTARLHYDDFMRWLNHAAVIGVGDPAISAEHNRHLKSVWSTWLDIWTDDCAKFVISGVDLYDKAIEDFGVQMAMHRALAFPAPAVYFQWEHESTIMDGSRVGAAGETIRATTAIFMRVVEHTDGILRVAMMRGADSKFGSGFDLAYTINLYGEKAEFLLNSPWDNLSSWDRTARSYLDEMLSFFSLLAIKDVAKTEHKIPDRQKEKREKRGLPPLPEYVTLHVSRQAVEREAAAVGIDRSSPRPHFRRGHIRTLHRGTDGQRIIPVAPSWVNSAPGEGRVPIYRVTK